MIEPHVHVAYAHRGAGVLCAAFWFAQGDDVYGWFTGARAHQRPASFFMLEQYYSTREAVCYRSVEDDAYGPSPGADLRPIVFLSHRWPLDYVPD